MCIASLKNAKLVIISFVQVEKEERKRWCSENFVSDRALRKAIDIHTQLAAHLATEQHAANGSSPPDAINGVMDSGADAESTAGLRRALTAGLAMHGAMRRPDGEQKHDKFGPACPVTGVESPGHEGCHAVNYPFDLMKLLRHAAGTFRLLVTNQLVMIHPSSVLSGRKAACIVFDELVQTARLYARNVTAIDPHWLPELAPQLFRTAPNATQ